MKIKITEQFLSLQGEGKFVGVPSVFVRVFGCNFTCAGFGQPRNNIIPIEEMPHNKFDVSSCSSIEELPVFDIGFDSSASWNKKYAHLSKTYSMESMISYLKETYFDNFDGYKLPHLVITGGEPLLPKYQRFWAKLFEHEDFIFSKITFETNGSNVLTKELKNSVLDKMKHDRLFELTFSVSPKLSISGESREKAINSEAVQSYTQFMKAPICRGEVYLKFVVRYELCIPEVKSAIEQYNFDGEVYLMPEGATDKGLSVTEKEVADIALREGFRFSPRLHIDLYGNGWGT